MEIEKFVSEVLSGIVRGAVQANKEISVLGGRINPTMYKVSDSTGAERRDIVCRAEFDVAVSVSDEKGANAKVGVISSVLGFSMGGEAKFSSGNVSRVKFSIPYSLPQTIEFKRDCVYKAKTFEADDDDFAGF